MRQASPEIAGFSLRRATDRRARAVVQLAMTGGLAASMAVAAIAVSIGIARADMIGPAADAAIGRAAAILVGGAVLALLASAFVACRSRRSARFNNP